MKKFLTLMSGNNRIAAIALIAIVAGADVLFGVNLNEWLQPVLDVIGFEQLTTGSGKVYGAADLAALFYGLFAVGLTVKKRATGKPENPSMLNPAAEASLERKR